MGGKFDGRRINFSSHDREVPPEKADESASVLVAESSRQPKERKQWKTGCVEEEKNGRDDYHTDVLTLVATSLRNQFTRED